MNSIALTGRVVRDAELKYIGDMPVANFSVAVNRDYKNKDGSIGVDFINVQAKFKTAEFVANYCTKGVLVGVIGSLKINQYKKDGENKTFTQVEANKVQKLSYNNENKNETASENVELEIIEDEEIPF